MPLTRCCPCRSGPSVMDVFSASRRDHDIAGGAPCMPFQQHTAFQRKMAAARQQMQRAMAAAAREERARTPGRSRRSRRRARPRTTSHAPSGTGEHVADQTGAARQRPATSGQYEEPSSLRWGSQQMHASFSTPTIIRRIGNSQVLEETMAVGTGFSAALRLQQSSKCAMLSRRWHLLMNLPANQRRQAWSLV